MRNEKGQFVKGWSAGFKKGQKIWNTDHAGFHPNTQKTQFKKGNKPHNYLPIGSESEREGYLYRKVSDHRKPSNKNWKQVHIIVWEQHYGEVPETHRVAFKDGDSKNIIIDNLELIDTRELMSRNTILRYPPELKQAIRLTAKLRRTINEKSE